ncbi:DUF222 domain-containing protein [Longivirga aurantiaca]|uniref:DUF222 domain-containing protein n=1 Tax=Longivirga aurantiaca TaxID=1837743 RepID=A0ABW1T2E8_9ACTN
MSTTFDSVETSASYDEAFPPGWSPVTREQEHAFAEALRRDFPPERHVDPAGDDLPDPGPFSELGLVAAVDGPADPFDLVLLHALDPESLSDPGDQLRMLSALDKVECLTQSLRIRTLMALGDDDEYWTGLDEQDLQHEIAIARRTSEYNAGKALELARSITRDYPDLLAALTDGRVSWGHLAVLVDRTRYVTDPAAIAAISARALTRALTRTPGQFATEVEKLVARFDPDAAERHRRAKKKERRVWVKRLADGMGMLGYVDDWAIISAVHETIAADARSSKKAARAQKRARTAARRDGTPSEPTPGTDVVLADEADVVPTDGDHSGPRHGDHAASGGSDHRASTTDDADDVEDEEPDADTARADALAARVLGTLNPDGSVVWDRAASVVFEGHLVIDFLTLTRERDRVALLDGQPLPPETAREYAGTVKTWRRFVTDHLIDVGNRYTDDTLHRFILARDICRNPVHDHIPTSTRLQMDHAEEAPHGPTSADNCGGICIPSHQLKTARRVDITDSRADGSCTWTTRAGQVVHIPPRPFLDHPDPPLLPRRRHGPAPDPADDIPPF